MDKEMISVAIAQERLNKLCLESEPITFPTRYMVSKIIEDTRYRDDIIDIIFANYFVNNRKCKDQNIRGVMDFIKIFYQNKDYLHDTFLNNTEMANVLVSDYRKNYLKMMGMEEVDPVFNRNYFYKNNSAKVKKIVSSLSQVYNYVGLNYVTDLARFHLYDMVRNISLGINNGVNIPNNFLELEGQNLVQAILFGDAYTYMCYNNVNGLFDNYIKLIEENSDDIKKLSNIVSSNDQYLRSIVIYATNMSESDEYYLDIYNVNELKKPEFKKYLKKINPYYIMDEIRDLEYKKMYENRK